VWQVFAGFMAKWWYFIELCGGYWVVAVVVINGMSAILYSMDIMGTY
jgi:hypothetical protein